MTTMDNLPDVVSREEWLAARKELLAKEKELTRARDRLNADRRRLPMVRVDKPYTFDGPDGTVSLLDLFDGRPQLVMHHFMFGPDWDQGCPSCSSAADGIGRSAAAARAEHHAGRRVPGAAGEARRVPRADGLDVPLVLVIRHRLQLRLPRHPRRSGRAGAAALPHRGRTRRGRNPVDGRAVGRRACAAMEMPGISAFLRVGDEVFHTYSTFGRGIEEFHNGYHYLDLTALGRQEEWEEPKGRAIPLGLQVGGPAMRLPDEYDA